MIEIFYIYLGFEVPWWNKVVTTPESNILNMMKYLVKNSEGANKDFCCKQFLGGLATGKEELILMTTKNLFHAPLMMILLCNL